MVRINGKRQINFVGEMKFLDFKEGGRYSYQCSIRVNIFSGPNLRRSDHGGHPGASTKQKQNPQILLRYLFF
jgi:hypothetical protein